MAIGNTPHSYTSHLSLRTQLKYLSTKPEPGQFADRLYLLATLKAICLLEIGSGDMDAFTGYGSTLKDKAMKLPTDSLNA